MALTAATLFPFASAHAAVISFTDTINAKLTDWDEAVQIGKFDTKLGTLTSIKFDLNAFVEGTGRAENLGAKPTTVTMNLGSSLELMRPDGSVLVVSNPLLSQKLTLAAFDGVDDLAGSSSGTTGLVKTSASAYLVSNDASDFALFSANGGGNIDLLLSAYGKSIANASGNFFSRFNTIAGGTATVTYEYTPVVVEVPEPATLATMIAGLALIGAARRRSRSKAQ